MTTEETITVLQKIKPIPCRGDSKSTTHLLQTLALDKAIKALEQGDVLDKIRAEIEQLHHHPKLDFINTDKVVDMALEIIDKYRESEDKK